MTQSPQSKNRNTLPSNNIADLTFDIGVAGDVISINSPDRLLRELRGELIDTIDKTINAASIKNAPVTIHALDIDLGHFDQPIAWDDVRQKLHSALTSAMNPYLTARKQPHISILSEPPFAGQTRDALRAMARARGLSVSGTKSNLGDRLTAHVKTPWGDATKRLKRAQGIDDIRLFLTGQKAPDDARIRNVIAHMTQTDVRAALAVISADVAHSSADPAKALARAMMHDVKTDAPTASAFETARARMANFKEQSETVGTATIKIQKPTKAHIFSYIYSELNLDMQISQRIPPAASQLSQAVANLADASDPIAAKRFVLAALIGGHPVDTAAARDAVFHPELAAKAALTRGLYAFGDDIVTAVAKVTVIGNTSQDADDPIVPLKSAVLDVVGHPGPALLSAMELIFSALRPALPASTPKDILFWGYFTETILSVPDTQRATIAQDFIKRLIPDAQKRDIALRGTIARLNYPAVASAEARAEARALLETMLHPAAQSIAAPSTPPDVAGAPRLTTQNAGLVLFHPYIAMLFERLEIQYSQTQIIAEHLPIAQAALNHLARGNTQHTVAGDPLSHCLLGCSDNEQIICAQNLPPAAEALIDGLVQSVIAQWGRLGNTSADGLRSAFIQRGGILDLTDEEPKLTVNKGAYDMLLDGLPWSFNLIALPWMPAPLHVDWRSRDD